MTKYNGLDIYQLYKYHRAVPADTAHHIQPAAEKPERFYSDQNLIPVSRQSHEEIHNRYKHERQADVIKELQRYKHMFEEDGGMEKVFG